MIYEGNASVRNNCLHQNFQCLLCTFDDRHYMWVIKSKIIQLLLTSQMCVFLNFNRIYITAPHGYCYAQYHLGEVEICFRPLAQKRCVRWSLEPLQCLLLHGAILKLQDGEKTICYLHIFLPPKLILLVQNYMCLQSFENMLFWLVPNCSEGNIFYISLSRGRKQIRWEQAYFSYTLRLCS